MMNSDRGCGRPKKLDPQVDKRILEDTIVCELPADQPRPFPECSLDRIVDVREPLRRIRFLRRVRHEFLYHRIT